MIKSAALHVPDPKMLGSWVKCIWESSNWSQEERCHGMRTCIATTLGVHDLERSGRFYDKLLEPLGLARPPSCPTEALRHCAAENGVVAAD